MELKIIFQYSIVFVDFSEASHESFLLHVLGGVAALQDLVWVKSFLWLPGLDSLILVSSILFLGWLLFLEHIL